ASGNFVLNCSEADWVLNVSINGYKSYVSKKVKIASGQKYDFGSITLEKNPLTLSGTVRNIAGKGILAANVKVYKDEVLIDEIASTPENGAFSFSLASGNYILKCEKTGFGFYSAAISLIASTQHNISLKPGASLVMGSIYGKSWSGDKYVYAPITNAAVMFIGTVAKDTVTVYTDAVYGDYKVSLPGDQTYTVTSKASGFVNSSSVRTITTVAKENFTFSDTLQSLAMISGTVVSDDGSSASGVKISLVKVSQNLTSGFAISAPNGHFEIKGLDDGKYAVKVGKVGYVVKDIDHDTVNISEGRPDYGSIKVTVEPGSKSVVVFLDISQNASLKFREPFLKDIKIGDTLSGVGDGEYMISVDADEDSVIDLTEYHFTVADTETIHTENVSLPVSHLSADTLVPNLGKVKINLKSRVPCDSVELYFKNSEGVTYTCEKNKEAKTEYQFEIVPPKDGSLMHYYFKVYINSDVYGSDKEVYETFIAPDKTILSYIEIYPVSNDTITFPASYQATFSFRGYYSSSYIQDTTIDASAISWKIDNPQGCKLLQATGLNVSVKTGKDSTTAPVILTAIVDTLKTRLKTGVSSSIPVVFNVSGAILNSISITRTDAATPNPITASATDKAEFTAKGKDRNGNEISILPKWSVSPQTAGKINQYGVFYPNENFVGNVRVFAENGSLSGEYDNNGKGLSVQYMIRHSGKKETVSNGRGCSITFPANIVQANEYGILDLTTEPIKNKIMFGRGNETVIDSVLVDIEEMNDVKFDLGSDSMRLSMAIPQHLQGSARSGARKMNIAFWNEDSLKWSVLDSKISDDKKTIETGLTHFSKYAIISQEGSSSYLDVKPNPFSPFVRQADPSKADRRGTCIKFQIESPKNSLSEILLRIYNMTGDIVWSLSIQNAEPRPYAVWWDGRTSSRENTLSSPSNEIVLPQGKKMCRNGRYFVVLTAKENNGKQKQMKKQIIMMK
ncbi:MAG: carboxypeptidase-like regulatory domain-containing protein, partial [Fibrobacter sp.]|nr:carboxypeptidase-like regulatory domain-containing protein [Fibrobacter sp.]